MIRIYFLDNGTVKRVEEHTKIALFILNNLRWVNKEQWT